MLYYRRRNSNTPIPPLMHTQSHPLLTYCNWSYDHSRHINTETLRRILSQFDERFIHVYLRLMNEVPLHIIDSFIAQEQLDPNTLVGVHHILTQRGFDLKDL